MIWLVLSITLAVAWTALIWVWKLEEDARFEREERSRKRDRWWDY